MEQLESSTAGNESARSDDPRYHAVPAVLLEACLHLRQLVVFTCGALVLCSASGQQPNGPSASLIVQFRHGPPYPIVADAPADGSFSLVLMGPPNAPFIFAAGPLNPGALSVGGFSWDLGTGPGFGDVQILADGTVPGGAAFHLGANGFASFDVPMLPGITLQLPPVQALIANPAAPFGFSATAASVITLKPAKSILFLQGDFDPGLYGLGPHCRLADTSPVGFSQLRDFLLMAGFAQVDEVVDTAVAITPQLLAPYGVLVLGSNARALAVAEADVIENFVRAGGGLVSYSDFMFGPGSVPSDNQVLTRFGLLTTYDNFGGTQLASSFAPHPISAGISLGVAGEGVSIHEIVGNGIDTIVNVADCASNGTACVPYPPSAPSGAPNPVYSVCAAVDAGAGRVVVTFDRNTFFNYPGISTNLFDASNLVYALNLFYWVASY